MTDLSFTYNTRYIINRYLKADTPGYAMDYAVFSSYNGSTHTSNLLPTFTTRRIDYKIFLGYSSKQTGIALFLLDHVLQEKVAPGLQQYLISHAIWGDPNHGLAFYAYHWDKGYQTRCLGRDKSEGGSVWNLMKPQAELLSVFSDNHGPDTDCIDSARHLESSGARYLCNRLR